MRKILRLTLAGAIPAAAFLVQFGLAQQTSSKGKAGTIPAGDWPMYSRDFTSTRYSPLKQINTQNVSTLQKVWSYRPSGPAVADAPASPPEGAAAEDNTKGKGKGKGRGPARPAVVAESTPIVVNGVMYIPAGRQVVALDADTGKEIWTHPTTG